MKKLSPRDKAMIVLLLVIVVIAAVKGIVFDPYRFQNDKEQEAYEYIVKDRGVPDGVLITGRLVNIKQVEKEYQGNQLEYGYELTFRDYFLKIVPFREWKVLV